jgi:mannose-6-phosphate isomerase-like protein (cupin superfamily)
MDVGTLSMVAIGAASAAAVYLVVGNLWHRVLSPLPAPDPATFPRAGDRFGSAAEGLEQAIDRIEGGMVFATVVLAPGAAGPPMHTHDGFSETYTVQEGTLSVQLVDRVVQVSPGEQFTVPAGVAHRPFNATQDRVVLGGGDSPIFPVSFAAALVQLYRLMDTRGTHPLTMMLQLSVNDPIADTHLAAMPRAMEPVLRILLAPAARLLGYRNYYPEWALHRA